MAKPWRVEVEFDLNTWLLSDCKVTQQTLESVAEEGPDGTYTAKGDIRVVGWLKTTKPQAEALAGKLRKTTQRLKGVRVVYYKEGQSPDDLLRAVGLAVQRYEEDHDDENPLASILAEENLCKAMRAAGLSGESIVRIGDKLHILHVHRGRACSNPVLVYECG